MLFICSYTPKHFLILEPRNIRNSLRQLPTIEILDALDWLNFCMVRTYEEFWQKLTMITPIRNSSLILQPKKVFKNINSAMKFWIGAAANVANMSVIWAQLYIDGKCYGVHAYIVPIRDRRTHKLLPGVLIGDCGPKNGLNEIDNGFMLFDNFRIPK